MLTERTFYWVFAVAGALSWLLYPNHANRSATAPLSTLTADGKPAIVEEHALAIEKLIANTLFAQGDRPYVHPFQDFGTRMEAISRKFALPAQPLSSIYLDALRASFADANTELAVKVVECYWRYQMQLSSAALALDDHSARMHLRNQIFGKAWAHLLFASELRLIEAMSAELSPPNNEPKPLDLTNLCSETPAIGMRPNRVRPNRVRPNFAQSRQQKWNFERTGAPAFTKSRANASDCWLHLAYMDGGNAEVCPEQTLSVCRASVCRYAKPPKTDAAEQTLTHLPATLTPWR